MLSDLRKSFNRRHLTDSAFGFLFDEDTSGEVVVLSVGATSFDYAQADLLEVTAIVIQGNRLLTSARFHQKVGAQDGSVDANPGAVALALLRFIGSRPLVGYYLDFAVNLLDRIVRPLIGVQIPNSRVEVSSLYYDQRRVPAGKTPADLRFDSILRDLDLPERGASGSFDDAVSAGLIYLTLRPPS
jgi:DNA polymerase-3 subunit epsilon